ncbi:MAG: discoidin domain-containing protein [Pseudomonadota bacterium]
MLATFSISAGAQKADIFGDDAVFVIEATSIEAVDTQSLPVEARKQVERLRAPPVVPQMAPLVLPAADYSAAGQEAEPNEKAEQGTPMPSSLAVTGEIARGDTDFYTFTIEGDEGAADAAQLWAIEAQGESIKQIGYLSGGRSKFIQSRVQGSAPEDANRFVLSNLLLYPGQHHIWVNGKGESPASYRLRAVALGPPDPAMEIEPNDDDSRAQALEFGSVRGGYLFTPLEQDLYYFTLLREAIVDLRFEPPPDVDASLTVSLGGGQQAVKTTIKAGQAPFQQLRRLSPGTYTVRLKAGNVGSAEPYRLLLSHPDLNALPVDLEPNDTPDQAVPLAPDHRIVGTPTARGEQDYYLLPQLAPGTQITVQAPGEVDYGERRRLVVIAADGPSNAPSLLTFDEGAGAWTGAVPVDADADAATRYVLRVQAWETPYDYQASFSPGPAPETSGRPSIEIDAPTAPLAVAAYLDEVQRLRVPITVISTGSDSQTLSVLAQASDPRWRVQQSQASLTLAPGERQTLVLGITVPADAGDLRPVRLDAVFRGSGGSAAVSFDVAAICGVAPVDASPAWPIPDELLGGINVAASQFGGVPVDGTRSVASLFDLRTPYVKTWSPRLGDAQVTVDLAGDAPVQVRGIALNPRTSIGANARPRRFRVATSTDGITFESRLVAELHAVGEEQAFAFDAPVAATHVRLTIEDTQQGEARSTALGEFKVIAEPATRPLGDGAVFNLADPDLGGVVVWSDPVAGRRPNTMLSEGKPDTSRRKLDVTRPNRWVVGFHHGRAAQITHLEWVQPPEQANTRRMSEVRVAVADHPVGPWTPLGAWTLDTTAEATSRLELPEPTWARFVQFTHTEAQDAREWWRDAETLRIFERPAGDGYRSILGEWGHYATPAIQEYHAPAPVAPETASTTPVAGNGSAETARELVLGEVVTGIVRVAQEEDWYTLRIPPQDNRLTLDLSSLDALRVRPTLLDQSGAAVPLERKRDRTGRPLFEAQVTPGAQYRLHLVEPPRSVVFVWDNSASVAPYIPQIYRALARFSEGLTPGREEGNLLALGAGAPLLTDWAKHPFELQQFLTNYDRNHSSSDSEGGMTNAAKALAGRDGTRAVVHIADGISSRGAQPAALWRAFADAPIRVFPLELQGGGSRPYQQDVMQSWAAVDNGFYDYFGTADDLERGFARAACLIRRPADYRLVAATRHEAPPEPGSLAVLLDDAVPLNAVEIILDASGSMWAQIDGKARITIAHDVLAELVGNTIPPGTPLAVRIFGHREARSCRTDLEVPLKPLVPASVVERIRAAKPKDRSKTPLAASLDAVASDLAGADGAKVVVLLTDGKETCDGDPPASIEALQEAGLDVRVNIVGFAIDDAGLETQFERWATLGGGRYFHADSEADLTDVMQQALRPKFQVLDASADVVAEGTAGGAGVPLPAGTYSVRLLTSPARQVDEVVIAPGQRRQLTIE